MVEILDRRGGVRHRVRLVAFPASLGRGYQNDVILDDRYIDSAHARVEWDGGGALVLIDQQSLNGLVDLATGTRVTRLPVRSGTEVRLGRTTVRFVDPTDPVDPAVAEAAQRGRQLVGVSALRDVAIAAGTGLLLGLNNYLQATGRVRMSGVVGEVLTALLVVAAWAGAWALVNRITQQRFRFLEHFVIACVVIAAYTFTNSLAGYLRFLFPGSVQWETGASLIGIFIAIAGLAAHLARVSLMPWERRWLWSAGVIGILGIVTVLSEHGDKPEFGASTEATPLKPLSTPLIPSETPAQFLKQVDELRQGIDELSERMAARDETRGE
jgi:FHA domain